MNHLSPATSGTLRERFVQDMTVRGFTDKTRHDYIRTVAGFAAFLNRSPALPLPRTSVASKSTSPSAA
jgi:integrase/recombinase XerD